MQLNLCRSFWRKDQCLPLSWLNLRWRLISSTQFQKKLSYNGNDSSALFDRSNSFLHLLLFCCWILILFFCFFFIASWTTPVFVCVCLYFFINIFTSMPTPPSPCVTSSLTVSFHLIMHCSSDMKMPKVMSLLFVSGKLLDNSRVFHWCVAF